MDGLPADYDANDILKTVREGVSRDGKLYALPLYGESAMTCHRNDLEISSPRGRGEGRVPVQGMRQARRARVGGVSG